MKNRTTGTHTISCTNCGKEIDCTYSISRYYPARGEYMYSLGQPEEPSEVEWTDAPEECPDCGEKLEAVLLAAEEKVMEDASDE